MSDQLYWPRLWPGNVDADITGTCRAAAGTAVERAVDERVDHRVRHPEEEDPQQVAVLDVAHVDERVDDEHNLVRCPADDERSDDDGSHAQWLHLGFAEQSATHGRCCPVWLHFHVLR